MDVRRTRTADVPALYDIFSEAIADLYRRHSFDPPTPPFEVFSAQRLHVLEHDRRLCAVAEEGGDPIAFGSAWARGSTWFLASLFLRPRAQSRGVGAVLLDAVWGDGYGDRRTITDVIQPVSNGLYARRGLIPVTPVLSFGGEPDADAARAAAAATRLEPHAWDDEAVRTIDDAAYGFDRRVDHVYWRRAARGTLWRRVDGHAVAYSYVFPGGAIGPVAATSPSAAGAALAAELARADGGVRVRIPGSAREVVATAVAARLRISPTPGLLLLGPTTPAPTALAIGSYTLL